MANKDLLSPFAPIAGMKNTYIARRGKMRAVAVVLQKGNVCLFNPVTGLGEDTLESLHNIGNVSHIVSPNHYHNAAASEYSAQFKKAKLCGSIEAIPRLEKVTGLKYSSIESLNKRLPAGFTFVSPDGLKTGEIWLRILNGQSTTWVVADAYCGPDASDQKCKTNLPKLLKTFPKFGVQDRDVYRSWLFKTIKADRPKMIIPCHGALVECPALPKRLSEIAENEL